MEIDLNLRLHEALNSIGEQSLKDLELIGGYILYDFVTPSILTLRTRR